jgi:hypothetical protein
MIVKTRPQKRKGGREEGDDGRARNGIKRQRPTGPAVPEQRQRRAAQRARLGLSSRPSLTYAADSRHQVVFLSVLEVLELVGREAA